MNLVVVRGEFIIVLEVGFIFTPQKMTLQAKYPTCGTGARPKSSHGRSTGKSTRTIPP